MIYGSGKGVSRQSRVIAIAASFALMLAGCPAASEDPKVALLRDKYVTATELDKPLSITEVAELIESRPNESEPLNVTVVGRIHAGELEPWEAGKASFMIAELPAEGHGEGHDADNCPFCKRRAAKAPAGIVKFVDDKNQTLPIDARELFQVSKGQRVAVRGTAIAGEFGSVVLTADQMHIFK